VARGAHIRRLADVKVMEKEFYPVFSYDDFAALPKYQIYLKIFIDGTESKGFSAISLSDFEVINVIIRKRLLQMIKSYKLIGGFTEIKMFNCKEMALQTPR